MAIKKLKTVVKIQLPAGKATPAPPVGTALGPHGINIGEFTKQFNDRTKDLADIIPAEISIFEDRSFTFILKTPPAAVLLKKAAGIEKGSGKPLTEKVGKVTKAQIKQIAETKMPDLNAATLEAAMRTIEGTARQMGLKVEE